MTHGSDLSWTNFRQGKNLLDASHRGLQRCLIPQWLQHPKSLNDRIEASAYGETPPALVEQILDHLAPGPDDLLVDLGCGGGNVCAAALQRGASVLGIERNPELFQAAQLFLGNQPKAELRCADFLESDWSQATLAYATTTRFPKAMLAALARKVETSPALRAIACLGRPLPLSEKWEETASGEKSVRWNQGEAVLTEPLFLYRR